VGFDGGFTGDVSSVGDLLCLGSDNVCGLEDLLSIFHGLLGGGEDILSVAPGYEGGGSVLCGFLKGSDSELVVFISGCTFGEGCFHRIPGELVGLDGGIVGFDSGHPDSVPSLSELCSSNLFLHVREENAYLFESHRNEGHVFGLPLLHSFLSCTKGTHGIQETFVGVSGLLCFSSSSFSGSLISKSSAFGSLTLAGNDLVQSGAPVADTITGNIIHSRVLDSTSHVFTVIKFDLEVTFSSPQAMGGVVRHALNFSSGITSHGSSKLLEAFPGGSFAVKVVSSGSVGVSRLAEAGLLGMGDGITEGFVVTSCPSFGVFVQEFSFSSILHSTITVAISSTLCFGAFSSTQFPLNFNGGSCGGGLCRRGLGRLERI